MNRNEAMLNRESVRSYLEEPLPEDISKLIGDLVPTITHPVTGASLDLETVFIDLSRSDEPVPLGSYGIIKHPQAYVTGICSNNDEEVLLFGYLMEHLVIELTMLGIGSCWLGGTFDRKKMSAYISAAADKVLPAVITLGYPHTRKGVLDTLIRVSAGSAKRRPFGQLFFQADGKTPLTAEEAGRFAQPLEMVRRAPSASNKQPWRGILDQDVLHMFLDESPRYNRALGYPIQMLDMGIAICHLRTALHESGVSHTMFFAEQSSLPKGTSLQYIMSCRLD